MAADENKCLVTLAAPFPGGGGGFVYQGPTTEENAKQFWDLLKTFSEQQNESKAGAA